MATPKQFEVLLEPFAFQWFQCRRRLKQLSLSELLELKKAADSATDENCWYATKEIADALVPLIEDEIEFRWRCAGYAHPHVL